MPKPPILTRLRKAAKALRGEPSPGLERWAASTVRPQDTHSYSQRRVQMSHAEGLTHFVGTVKVAASRNAHAVASLNLRLMRRKSPSAKSWWETRAVPRAQAARLKSGVCGMIAAKAMSRFGDVEEVVDPMHPVLRVLQQANPLHNGYELMEMTQIWLGLTGDAYWYVARDGEGTPQEVWPLCPAFVRAVPAKGKVIGQYIYGTGTEVEQVFEAEEIIHFRNVNPTGNPYHGTGDLEACVREAQLNSAFVEFAINLLQNGATPGMVISGNFVGDQREQVELALRRQYEGIRNTGRTLVFPGDLTVTPLQLSEKEVSFLSSADRMDQVIANCFDMPISILRLDTAALATAKAAIPQWQLMAIQPRARKAEDTINQRLVVQIMGDENTFVVFDDAVTKDIEATATRVTSVYSAGLTTKNEARNELGLDDVEGGDEFKQEPVGLGGGEGGFGFGGNGGRASEGGKQDGGDGDKDRGAGKEDEREAGGKSVLPPRARLGDVRVRMSDESGRLLQGDQGLVRPDRDGKSVRASDLLLAKSLPGCCHRPSRLVRKDDRLGAGVIQATELELEAALRNFFRQVTGQMLPQVNGSGMAFRLSGNESLAKAFMDATSGPLGKMYLGGWNSGIGDLLGAGRTTSAPLAALTEDVTKYLRRFQGRLNRSVFETVDDRVGEQLAQGIEQGESIPQLQQRLAGTMESVTTYGAERIARTESARAYLTAREESWQEIGGVRAKRWLLSADPCPICQTMAENYREAPVGTPFLSKGATIQLLDGTMFRNDYADMDVPPAHPQCRCSMAAVFEE
jgi:HK97 family phage portal protein